SISVTLSTFNGSGTVNVSPPTLVALSLDPTTMRLAPGMYNYIAATAVNSDGSTNDVSATATWSSTDTTIADVQLYQGYAYVLAGNTPGIATVKATLATGQTA